MEQPEGYQISSAIGSRLVCKLSKALYGILNAPALGTSLSVVGLSPLALSISSLTQPSLLLRGLGSYTSWPSTLTTASSSVEPDPHHLLQDRLRYSICH
jgi:hypothetical protein